MINSADLKELMENEPDIEGRPSVKSADQINNMDSFDAPIPGQGMTEPPGGPNWERPSEFSDPKEGYIHVIEQIEKDEVTKENFKKLMWSGIPIEALVNTIAFSGFGEGKWSVDTAEIIKLPLTIYFANIAQEENIPAVLFNTSMEEQRESKSIDDETIFRIMKENNPELYEQIKRGIDEQLKDVNGTSDNLLPSLETQDQEEEEAEPSFMDVEEEEI